jgi:hypothetical protein
MEKRDVGGGCRILGVDFRYPKRRAITPFAAASGVCERPPRTKGPPALHQADRSITQFVRLQQMRCSIGPMRSTEAASEMPQFTRDAGGTGQARGFKRPLRRRHRAQRRNSNRHRARTDYGSIGNRTGSLLNGLRGLAHRKPPDASREVPRPQERAGLGGDVTRRSCGAATRARCSLRHLHRRTSSRKSAR